MEINRNQYFLAGLVFLLLGLQFRVINTVSLTPECAGFLAARINGSPAAGSTTGAAPAAKAKSKTFHPPEWIGWAMLSLGSVLILHSLAMKRPE